MKIIAIFAFLAVLSTPVIAHDQPANSKIAQSNEVPIQNAPGSKVNVNSDSTNRGPIQHGGGLDRYGCHTNHKTGDYHCHR